MNPGGRKKLGTSLDSGRRTRPCWTAPDAGNTDRSRHEFVCECGDAACSEPILLTMLEYAVRVHGRRFAVALDHEDPEVERVVAEEATHAP